MLTVSARPRESLVEAATKGFGACVREDLMDLLIERNQLG